jgi:hypothetical protein
VHVLKRRGAELVQPVVLDVARGAAAPLIASASHVSPRPRTHGALPERRVSAAPRRDSQDAA